MIKIVTDSAADIPKETVEKLNIQVLPFIINIDGKQIIADNNLSPDEFYTMVDKCVEIPSTCQMSPSDIEDIYRGIGNRDTIIHITMSAKGSGINNTANLVASQLNDEEGFDITVVDSGKFAMTIGAPAIVAAEMAQDGASKEEILNYLTEEYTRDTAYFLVDDLTFLKKSGRIKATTMAISKVLDIKPILFINNGLVEAMRKVRGLKKSLSVLVDFIEERMDSPEENEVMILDSNAPDKVAEVEQMIKERINPKKITYAKIGPVITSHAGTGLVGVYFKHKKTFTEYED